MLSLVLILMGQIPEQKMTAESAAIEIEAVTRAGSATPLSDRLLKLAQDACAAGRFDDAVSIARRAKEARGAAPSIESDSRAAALAAIAEVERTGTPTVLSDRMLKLARDAVEDGRYDDAIRNAQRAKEGRGRIVRGTERTAFAAPVTEAMFDALGRLNSAEARNPRDPRVVAARELYSSAEIELAAENYSRADELARRVVNMLSSVPVRRPDDAPRINMRINANTATVLELGDLPDWTDERVRNFLWYRRNIGPIRSLAEFRFIPGFSEDYLPFAELYFTL